MRDSLNLRRPSLAACGAIPARSRVLLRAPPTPLAANSFTPSSPLRIVVILACAILAGCGPAPVDDDPFGYEQLKRELGADAPDGSGVAVHLVEASMDITEEVDGVETKVGTGFAPNIGVLEFSGKNIEVIPGVFAHHSGHATGMGRKFFGNTTSTSPGIDDVIAWESMTWMGAVLNVGRDRLPASSRARVANHSWVGSADHPELPGTRNLQALRRIDWLVDEDEFVQVAGFSGDATSPLFSSAHNVIAVSHVEGAYTATAAPVGSGDYPDGRARPLLVVPELNPSSSVARVSSAIALLIETGHSDASLSSDPVTSATKNRNGDTIFNAERSEVIRAALLAGAVPVAQQSVIDGLDLRYGAGRLNVRNSVEIIRAGEHNSIEDEPDRASPIIGHGFDYDPEFGGSTRNTRATYALRVPPGGGTLTATLTWNAQVSTGVGLAFDRHVAVVDLDLVLNEVAASGERRPVAVSASRVDNVEIVRVSLDAGKDYEIQVVAGPGQSPFRRDYGLAWRMAP